KGGSFSAYHEVLIDVEDLHTLGEVLAGARERLAQTGRRKGGVARGARVKSQRRDRGGGTGRRFRREINGVFADAREPASLLGVLAEPDLAEAGVAQIRAFPDEGDAFEHCGAGPLAAVVIVTGMMAFLHRSSQRTVLAARAKASFQNGDSDAILRLKT